MFPRKQNRRTASHSTTGHSAAMFRRCHLETLEDRKLMAADAAFALATEPVQVEEDVVRGDCGVYEVAGAYSRRGCLHLDFGDAPDTSVSSDRYPTRLIDDGARHATTGPFLGDLRDGEKNGQPSVGAIRDGVDEDGVTLFPGVAFVEVSAGDTDKPLLNAWVDFNGDGDWEDAGEQIFTDVPVADGMNVLTYDVPDGFSGGTYARFRLSNEGGLKTTGLARDGEVEDYHMMKFDEVFAAAMESARDSQDLGPTDPDPVNATGPEDTGTHNIDSSSDPIAPQPTIDGDAIAKRDSSYRDSVDDAFAHGAIGYGPLGL